MLAKIYILPKKDILDPQGQAVLAALKQMGFTAAEEVKIGKYIEINFSEGNLAKAKEIIRNYCDKNLTNPNVEEYRFDIENKNNKTPT